MKPKYEPTVQERILDLLIVSSHAMTAPTIARNLGINVDVTYKAVHAMTKDGKLVTQAIDHMTTGYLWAGRSNLHAPRVPGRQVNVMAGRYDGAELRPFADRPDCNQHEQYGSRMGSVISYRDGTKTTL